MEEKYQISIHVYVIIKFTDYFYVKKVMFETFLVKKRKNYSNVSYNNFKFLNKTLARISLQN